MLILTSTTSAANYIEDGKILCRAGNAIDRAEERIRKEEAENDGIALKLGVSDLTCLCFPRGFFPCNPLLARVFE